MVGNKYGEYSISKILFLYMRLHVSLQVMLNFQWNLVVMNWVPLVGLELWQLLECRRRGLLSSLHFRTLLWGSQISEVLYNKSLRSLHIKLYYISWRSKVIRSHAVTRMKHFNFIWNVERGSNFPFDDLLLCCSQQLSLGQPEAERQELSPDLTHWLGSNWGAITWCLLECTWASSWNEMWSWNLKPGFLLWDTAKGHLNYYITYLSQWLKFESE